ncbi:MAG: hypothetical protein ACFB9M_04125 [Myxococcota bacterium]
MEKRAIVLSLLCAGFGLACQSTRPTAPQPVAASPASPAVSRSGQNLAAKVNQFVVAELDADLSSLPDSERQTLDLLIEASKLLDPIFDRQAYRGSPELRARLAAATGPQAEARLQYFDIMRGPWDRQDHHAPFAIDRPRPPGAGYYPEDITADELRAYVRAHPEQKAALYSLFTVVHREAERLVAEPYHVAYRQWLEPAAAKLEEAAETTENESLTRFLESRAEAFRTSDYYESDKAWMDLDSRVEITIGPYETYEDKLLGLKAAFESFVTVSDPEASRRLRHFKDLLPDMEQNLPVPDQVKTVRGRESPIRVVDLVFSSGDARKSVQTIAFNLPNDERVRKEKGAKKVLLRNLIETKFDEILKPIGQRILDPSRTEDLDATAFFNQVLFHELSHSLGPAFTRVDGERQEVRLALGSSYSPIEECKADVMGAYNVLYMIERGEFPEDFEQPFLISYFAGLFRSIRFGVAEAHGKGAAIQLNRFLAEGAARIEDDRFSVDTERLEVAIEKLTRDLVLLQHDGDKAGVDALLDQMGRITPPLQFALDRLSDVPVDIRPVYPLAGETPPAPL